MTNTKNINRLGRKREIPSASIKLRSDKNILEFNSAFRKTTIFSAIALFVLLGVVVFPALSFASIGQNSNPITLPQAASSSLVFIADADALVKQSSPSTKYGTSSYLQVDSVTNANVESFIRFSVAGLSGDVQSATLRVYDTTNGSTNGPAVYGTSTSWTEAGITWNTRPTRTSGAVDNKGAISTQTWVEYNVTSLVTGNGTFSFVLVADSPDGLTFSSRQGAQPPQLVIVFDTGTVSTASASPTSTDTPLPVPSFTPTQTQTIAASGSLAFIADADALVKQSSPSTKYGTSSYLQVDSVTNANVESFIQFSVAGLSGNVQGATLRVYDTTNGSTNGPAVHGTGTSWTESGITWNTRPARTSGAVDNKGAVSTQTWVEYNVTSLVTGNGVFSFVLVADSTDGLTFSSRQGAQPPQLVITFGVEPTVSPTLTASPTAIGATTITPTATPTSTSNGSSDIQHVFVIVMENHAYEQVWDTSSTPYITELGETYAWAANYHALIHPSLPNYLQMYGGSNYGITTNCLPSATCHIDAVNLADNLEAKGLTWKGYMDSMPAPCYLTNSGEYVPRHNPFLYFDNIRTNSARCTSHVVPYEQLAIDLGEAATTPNYSFITPDLCNGTHDCSISIGDTWLKNNVPAILNSPACTVDVCLLILTWDEDDGNYDNHILTVFAGSGAKTGGVSSTVPYTHYSMLRTIEDIFGLPTQTNNDAAASPMNDLLR